jgi:hypothetical protein
VSEVLLPRGALDRLGMPCGVIERPRHTGPGGSTSKPTGRRRSSCSPEGLVPQTFCPGPNLDALLAKVILILDGRALEADVRLGYAKHALPLRLLRVHTPQAYGGFLPHLPPKVSPRQMADLSRVRWAVELSRKMDESVHRRDQIAAEPPTRQ